MAEQITTVEEMNNEQYIAALEEMRANTVSRDAYNQLRAENKKLLDAMVNGETIETTPEDNKPSIDELRKKLFDRDGDMSNLEYVETALSLRDSLIEAGERDPFLPCGDKVVITADIIDTAERVATCLRECVDFAQGDSGVFSAELQRRTKDVSIPRGR